MADQLEAASEVPGCLEELIMSNQVNGRVTAELARRVLKLAREQAGKRAIQQEAVIAELRMQNAWYSQQIDELTMKNWYHR